MSRLAPQSPSNDTHGGEGSRGFETRPPRFYQFEDVYMSDEPKTPVLYRHHIHSAMREAVAAMREREEARNGKGWSSTERQVLEDALKAMNERRYVDIKEEYEYVSR